MARSKVTLKDLSRRTGFDKSTISRVLRNDETLSIRKENIDLIKQVAVELNYVPDAAARSLRSARSYSIGALVPSLQNQIYAQIVEGASEACRKRDYSLIIAQAARGDAQIDVVSDMVKRNRVDGLMALTFRSEYSQLQTIQNLAVPVMAVNWRAPPFKNWVTVDELPGACMATRHLIELGHRRIAHLGGDHERFNPRERLLGYKMALAEAGIAFDPQLVELAGYSFDDGFSAMNTLMDRNKEGFTAVFCLSMLTAAGAISALKKRNILVPQDVSVVGFHDGLMAAVMSPSLSTVAYPLVEMGKVAADGLMDILDGKVEEFTRVIGNPQLVARDSAAPPSRPSEGASARA